MRRAPWWAALAAIALLTAFAAQAGIAARRDSVTIDEFVHLPVGYNAIRTGDVSQDPINPHLSRMIAALPLLWAPPRFDPDPRMVVWSLGYHLMEQNADRYHELYQAPRWMIIGLSLVTAIVAAVWAWKLYDWRAALVTLALFAFTPSMLAHGHLVTLDMAGTLGFVAALLATWSLLARPTPARAALLGATLGIANLMKLSAFVLTAIVLVLVVVRAVRERDVTPRRWAMLLLVVAASALFTLNAGYGFEGTFSPIGRARLDPGGTLGGIAASMSGLRLPFPRAFLEGVDMILEVGKNREPSYFLAGELSAEGWWYYHLAAFAAKCPIPVLLSSLLAIVVWAARRSTGRRDYCVFVPVLLLFAANSAFNSLYIGERHVLPAYPLLMIGASPWIASALSAWRAGRSWLDRVLPIAAALLLIWTAAGTLLVGPRYLQYFNEAAGGAERGHRMLIDSNIDWGQDLIRLREYMETSGTQSVALAYFGRVDPRVYGVRYTPLEPGRSRGKVAVSATFLMGRPYFWILGGRQRWVPANTYSYLQGMTPVARAGSMFVFDVK